MFKNHLSHHLGPSVKTMPETTVNERNKLNSPVDAFTKLFFLFGDPIDHVRAPIVWSALMKRYDINSVLLPAHVNSTHLKSAIEGCKALENTAGLMFTMPHKVAAIKQADSLTERARLVNSINLMRKNADGTWTGDNVDGAGFIAGLKADGVNLNGIDAYVHGCGGVGECIAWSLALENIASLTVFDINHKRATELALKIANHTGKKALASSAVQASPASLDLMVNASPLGLHEIDALPFALEAAKQSATIADVIMEPMITRLLKTAAQQGLKIHHGRNMMNFAMPLAAEFYGLPTTVDWNGGPLQNS